MAGTGRIYVVAVREVGTIQSTHQYDVDVRFDIAFDWGGKNLYGVPYSISCDGQSSSGTATFNIASGGGSWIWGNIGGTKTFRITMPSSGKTKTISLSATINTDVTPSTISASGSYTLSAVTWQWPVSYNANGGSGAPDNQTKTYGKDLTLSSTKPTRTGYTFKGWATSSDGSVAYAAGAKYTANAAVTLYAVWQINTYAVSYNANGGSGAPDNQTKTYGKDLTLSSTVPTRTNYNFLGWATSSTANAPQYASGGTYKNNAAVTLYAVWELAYWSPKITKLRADRCSSSGDSDDYGTNAKVTFNFECCQITGANDVATITIQHKLKSDTEWTSTTVEASGTDGSVIQIIGSDDLSVESNYDIKVTVTDNKGGSTSHDTSIGGAEFPFDIKAGGTGVAFGKPAEMDDVVDTAWYFNAKSNTIDSSGTAPSSNVYRKVIVNRDSKNTVIGYLESCHDTDGNIRLQMVASRKVDDVTKYCSIACIVDETGIPSYIVTDKAAFRKAINAFGAKALSSYNGLVHPDGTDESWVRTTLSGLLPYQSGGASQLGSSAWPFNAVFSKKLYADGRNILEQKVLWSGASHMNGNRNASLSEAITAQPHGVCVGFSEYDNTNAAVKNSGWHWYFVPKSHVINRPGDGITFLMHSCTMITVGGKYIYFYDNYLSGYANNTASGTGSSGIKYNNSNYVLRYVIGV